MNILASGQGFTFLRHTLNEGDALTDEGVASALNIGSSLADRDFALVVVSGMQRTAQTAACVLAAGSTSGRNGVFVHEGFGSDDWKGWGDLIKRVGSSDVKDLARADEARYEDVRKRVKDAMNWTADRLGFPGEALIVSHSPIIEFAIWELTGKPPAPFERGQYASFRG
jgi:broad specificity phosphatase PhoE